MYLFNLGNQISTPAIICKTPKNIQTADGMLLAKEQGGCKNDKNLSNPIIKKRRLQIAVIIFIIFIGKDFIQTFLISKKSFAKSIFLVCLSILSNLNI